VRQGAVRSSKRNEKLAAKRGVNLSAVTTPMQIEQQVQTEMNVRAVRRARQVVQQQQQPQTTMTGTTARGRRKKKPAATTTNNMEQVKVMRQIKQEGKKAAQQLRQSQKIKNATAAPAAVVVPRKAIQAARNALKDSGVAIPRGYTLQLVPPPSAAASQPKQQPPKPKPQQMQQQQKIQQPTAQTKNRRRRPANK
jgi:hypothetical protein